MTVQEMIRHFEEQDELRGFGGQRNHMTAFILLNTLIPCEGRFISCAAHDQIWFDTDLTKLAEIITVADIKVLVENGVWVDTDVESLSMFV